VGLTNEERRRLDELAGEIEAEDPKLARALSAQAAKPSSPAGAAPAEVATAEVATAEVATAYATVVVDCVRKRCSESVISVSASARLRQPPTIDPFPGSNAL
jgi:hypothetical protein